MPGRRGQPTKLTAATSLTIVESVRAGVHLSHAAARAGVHAGTVGLWIRKGKHSSQGLHHDFFVAVTRARGEAIARNVALIQTAARRDWRAAAWWLRVTLPELYGGGPDAVGAAGRSLMFDELGLEVFPEMPEVVDEKPRDATEHMARVYAALEEAGIVPALPAPRVADEPPVVDVDGEVVDRNGDGA